MADTKISWCDKVWNPVTGCTKVSEGCRNCYAERMAKRLRAMGQSHYANGFRVTCHDDALDMPLHLRKPARIFVNSMSDLFHSDVPFEFIDKIFQAMSLCQRHTFMILTKRPVRMIEYFKWSASNTGEGPLMDDNVWLGVSVENQKTSDERIPLLMQTPAAVRFLSCEPLIGSINLENIDYSGVNGFNYDCLNGIYRDQTEIFDPVGEKDKIDWVIVGGESGPHFRPMELDWARSLREQCKTANVPFFFKQTGGIHHGSDLLDGVEYKEFPK